MGILNKLLVATLLIFGSLNANAQQLNTKKGVAIEGYDVVAYFAGEAAKGSDAYTAEYNGVRYQFSVEANLKAFRQNPEAYLPQYGGYCAYAIAKTGDKVDVNPKTYEIRDGKLYLFYNAWGNNTLKKWLKAPETLREQADENWQH